MKEWLSANFPHEPYIWKYKWFPFYRIDSQDAIRIDIFQEEDRTMFKLAWPYEILKEEDRSA